MNENIDFTQWLPRGASVVNPYRASKPDMTGEVENGRVTRAGIVDNSMMGYLLDRGFIENNHKESAFSFLELRNAFNSKTQHKISSIFNKITGIHAEAKSILDAYEHILSGIGVKGARHIEVACEYRETQPSPHIMEVMFYKDLFEMMDNLVTEAWKKVADEEKSICNA